MTIASRGQQKQASYSRIDGVQNSRPTLLKGREEHHRCPHKKHVEHALVSAADAPGRAFRWKGRRGGSPVLRGQAQASTDKLKEGDPRGDPQENPRTNGYMDLTRRKPMPQSFKPGEPLGRFAERQLRAFASQRPPRTTRLEPPQNPPSGSVP